MDHLHFAETLDVSFFHLMLIENYWTSSVQGLMGVLIIYDWVRKDITSD